MIGGGESFYEKADAVISVIRDKSNSKPSVIYLKINKKKKTKYRFPRKIKKWVKRSCHFDGMHGKLPLWSNNECGGYISDRACDFHKPPRKIWHIKSKRHRK